METAKKLSNYDLKLKLILKHKKAIKCLKMITSLTEVLKAEREEVEYCLTHNLHELYKKEFLKSNSTERAINKLADCYNEIKDSL